MPGKSIDRKMKEFAEMHRQKAALEKKMGALKEDIKAHILKVATPNKSGNYVLKNGGIVFTNVLKTRVTLRDDAIVRFKERLPEIASKVIKKEEYLDEDLLEKYSDKVPRRFLMSLYDKEESYSLTVKENEEDNI